MKQFLILVAILFVSAVIAVVAIAGFYAAETVENTMYIRDDGALCREETMECFEDSVHNDGTIDGYNESVPTCGGFICVY
jgi:uncharacterized protein YxeA